MKLYVWIPKRAESQRTGERLVAIKVRARNHKAALMEVDKLNTSGARPYVSHGTLRTEYDCHVFEDGQTLALASFVAQRSAYRCKRAA